MAAVVNKRSSEVFLKRFEEISLWMRRKPGPVTADLDYRIKKRGMEPDKARQRSLKLLDTRLAARQDPWFQLGLTHHALKRDVRERYQRLMQMYHPDKGLGEAAWLTSRVTRIRQAYDEIEASNFTYKPRRAPRVPNPDRLMSEEWQSIATANRRRPGNLRSSPTRPPLATRLRRRLGDAEKFKRRLMFTLLAGGLLYAVVLIHSLYSDMPTRTASFKQQTTISQ